VLKTSYIDTNPNRTPVVKNVWFKRRSYLLLHFRLCYARLHRWGIMRWWPLSVCLSVRPSFPCLTLSREWKGV